jgi:transcriptional regulator with XRE-family HTH domain
MATFGEYLRKERKKKKLNQSKFGQRFGIIMTDISKIENNHKKFPFEKLEQLAEFIKIDYTKLKDLYVADKLVDEAHKYNCTDEVFNVAENQSKYEKNKNIKQGKLAI